VSLRYHMAAYCSA